MNQSPRDRYRDKKLRSDRRLSPEGFKRRYGCTSRQDSITRSSRKTLVYKETLFPEGTPDEPILIVPGDQIYEFFQVVTWMTSQESWRIRGRLLTRRDRNTDWYRKARPDRHGNLWMKPGTHWPV